MSLLFLVFCVGIAIDTVHGITDEPCDCTKWLNRDLPSASGDWELVQPSAFFTASVIKCPKNYVIQAKYGTNIMNSEVQVLAATGQKVHFRYRSPPNLVGAGFYCVNKENRGRYPQCKNYQVRFCCPGLPRRG